MAKSEGQDRESGVAIASTGDAVGNLTAQIQRIQTTATQLSQAVDSVSTLMGGTNADIYGNVIAVNGAIGGVGTVTANTAAIDDALLITPTGVISNDLAAGRGLLVATLGATLEDDVQGLNNLIDGTTSGSSLQARIGDPTSGGSPSNAMAVIGGTGSDLGSALGDPGPANTLIGNVGGSTTSVQSALNALSTILVNNTNFSSSLSTQATTLSSNLDNGLSSLPNGATFAGIQSVGSDGIGGVNIGINSGLGSANGTYNLAAAAIAGNISTGSSFTLVNGGNNLVLFNQSGAPINTQAQALSYLASMYPVGSKLAVGMSDKISGGLSRQVGGTASSARGKIAAVDRSLLNSPTGVAATDLATARAGLVTVLGSTLESDVETLNSQLNGTAGGSTTQARIGDPTVNGASSNLASVIGGVGVDLATNVGDPVVGGSGLSALTSAASATNSNGVWSDISPFQSATSIYDQLNAFLALFNTSTWANSSNVNITFTISGAAPTSLADLISSATSTS